MVRAEIYWWYQRLLHHHGSHSEAVEAQIRHIGAEYGELLQEIQKYNGDNPRRPVNDELAGERALDEMADIVITTLVTMSLADNLFSDSNTSDPATAALFRVNNRFRFTMNRMQQFDAEILRNTDE